MSWSIVRRQLAQQLAILLGADPARVDRRDDVRPALAASPSAIAARVPTTLGPVHVGVDDVRAGCGQVRGQRARPRSSSSGSSMTVTAMPVPLRACGPRCRCDSETTRHVVAARVDPASAAPKRCSWAPPFVPVARISTTRTRGGPGSASRVDRLEAGIARRRERSSQPLASGGRAAAGSARRPRPTRTCRARCRAGSRAGDGRSRWPAGRTAATRSTPGDSSRASGSTPGVVVARCVSPSSKWIPAAIRRPADRQEAQRDRARRRRTPRTGGG